MIKKHKNHFVVFLTIVLKIITLLPILCEGNPELFGQAQKFEKLSIKNQIGFHFKKEIREVAQELFVSRRIDISRLLQGITVLDQTHSELTNYCSNLHRRIGGKRPALLAEIVGKYSVVDYNVVSSFAEARAKCTAVGMQLPEVYTEKDRESLSTYLKGRNITGCFAGIAMDYSDKLFRFIATGYPFWMTPHAELARVSGQGGPYDFRLASDDINLKFIYTDKGEITVSVDEPHWILRKKPSLASITDRDSDNVLSQTLMKVVCEQKWDGTPPISNYRTDVAPEKANMILHNRYSRSVTEEDDFPPFKGKILIYQKLIGIQKLCNSVADQANELYVDLNTKVTDLLSLVDITIRTESQLRKKRNPFLLKFMFSSGVRLIWSVFGFLQNMRIRKKIKKLERKTSDLESAVTKNKVQIDENTNAITNMSRVIVKHSIAIDQLNILVADLDDRVTVIERRMSELELHMQHAISTLDVTISLALVSNLIQRIQQSLNSGYEILANIIHASLVGQTSPLLLPGDQIKNIQNDVGQVCACTLDTDFEKMKSIVVSDPNDNRYLVVVINAAALSATGMELVNLVPIPFYEQGKAFIPVLDHTTIMINQQSRKYYTLSDQEEQNCLSSRCYISDVERSVAENACGIPQFFDLQPQGCLSEEIPSNGIFLRPMLPDGVFFSFREEVGTQLFCTREGSTSANAPKKLNRMGILYLPNGCTLLVTDKDGKSSNVRGQPLYHIMEVDTLSLSAVGPISFMDSTIALNESKKVPTYDKYLVERLTSMVKQVDTVSTQITHHNTHIWGLTGAAAAIIILIVVIIFVLYKYSKKFRKRIKIIKNDLIDLVQKIISIERTVDSQSDLGRRNTPPPIVPRKAPRLGLSSNVFLKYKREDENVSHYHNSSPYVGVNSEKASENQPNEYLPLRDFKHIVPMRQYPRLTPLLNESLKDNLDESEEIKRLCQATSLSANQLL